MPAEGRLKGVAVVVGLEDKEAALCAPIPFVGPVAGPLLEAWAAPRTRRLGGGRGGDLAARRDDRIALLLRDRRRRCWARTAATATATDEVGQAGGAEQVHDRLAPEHRVAPRVVLGRVVAPRLQAQGQPAAEEDPVAQSCVYRVQSEVVGWIHAHVEPGVAPQEVQDVLLAP